jgi:hypothetical protein
VEEGQVFRLQLLATRRQRESCVKPAIFIAVVMELLIDFVAQF